MKKLLCALLCAVFCNVCAFAQYTPEQQPILPKAPNSMMLERFGDYQVSMYTGIPDISIPLYTITTAGFEVPITLSYHASGLRVTDFPSWVGLGWALDAGGQINRNLVGIPDEDVNNGWLTGKTRSDWTINHFSYTDMVYVATMAGNVVPYGNQGINSAIGDMGPDIFSYSFPGGSGKFFFNKIDSLHFSPILMPYAPVNIAYTKGTGTLSFNLKDASGNKYQYGKSVQEISVYSSTGRPNYAQTTAWMLEQMISATKADTINFAYQGQSDPTPQETIHTWTLTDKVNEGPVVGPSMTNPPVSVNYYPIPGSTAYVPGTNPSVIFSSSVLGSEQPQQITYRNGKVVFILDNTARQDFGQSNNSKPLKQIMVYSLTGSTYQLLKSVTFYYSYFINGSDATTKRLRLDSLQVSDSNSSVIKSYKFVYNTASLPGWGTLSKDYWGYYNGRSNSYLVPQQTVPYWPYATDTTYTNITIGSNNPVGREPDSVNMQAAILQRIYYPTGGYTNFQYETNKYFDTINMAVKLAGGLRVKSIQSYDGISATPLITNYQYGTAGLGTQNFFLSNFYFSSEKQHQHWYLITNTGQQTFGVDGTARIRTFFENPTINITPLDGSAVVYPFVIESRTDGTNLLGKTEYRYNFTIDYTIPISNQCSKTATATHFYARGQLLDKKVYKAISAGVYQPVQETTNTYNTTSFAGKNVFAGMLADQAIIREGTGAQFPYYTTATFTADYLYANMAYQSDDNYLTSTINKTYDSSDSTQYAANTIQYAYTDSIHQQPTAITTVDSKGETIVTNNRYAADYIPSGNTKTGNAVLDTMLTRNMQKTVIEQWSTLQKPSQAALTTGGTINIYQQTSNLILPNQDKRLQVTTPLTNYVPASIAAGALHTDSRYEALWNFNVYDGYGNLGEQQHVNGVEVVYLWGYGREYPVAKIVGSNYSNVTAIVTQAQVDAATAIVNNDAAVRTLLNNLRTGLPNAQVTTLTYIPQVGMSSETDPKGEITYYEYDTFQRLMNIKDTNGNITKHYSYHYVQQ